MRGLPQNLAPVQIDRRDPAVRRLPSGRPCTRSLPPVARLPPGSPPPAADPRLLSCGTPPRRRLRRIPSPTPRVRAKEPAHKRQYSRWQTETPCASPVEGSAGPVRGRLRHRKGIQRPLRLAQHRRSEDRPDFVFRDQLHRLGSQLRREVDQVVDGHAGAAVSGGFEGIGCVGEYHSPGTSPFSTGCSAIGQTGFPVTRSNT